MSAAEHERAAREAMARDETKIAAAHADAARALLAAEKRACAGIAPRDIAPGVSGLEVIRMSRLERPVKANEVVEGAAVVVATNGRSFETFERLMECRAARAAVTRDALDPLAVDGASVRVYRDDGDAVVVQLRSRNPERADEILRRVARQVGERRASETRSSDPEDPLGVGRPGDGGTGDPRTHGSAPSGTMPGSFPPIDGATGPGRRR